MKLCITRPDDWHLHLRDGEELQTVVGHSAAQFGRAIIMPNLPNPVTTTHLAKEYRDRILKALPVDCLFEPLMTLYLTEQTTPEEIQLASRSQFVKACKLYPAGATTNSDAGVKDIRNIYPVLESMQKQELILCLHGEVVDPHIDIYDRERIFIDRVLTTLIKDFPDLKIVMEHITTAEAVQFIENAPPSVAATVTPQHLLYNRNHMLAGGIRPHFYCLPVLKRNYHRQALRQVICSGNPKFFLGTDSAPHAQSAKENACGCAGMYSAHAALELYAEVFETMDSLDKLEGFASFFGADFYAMPRNTTKIELEKSAWKVPVNYKFADSKIIPIKSGETLFWKLSQ